MTNHEMLELAYRAYRPGESYTRLVNDAGADYWDPRGDDGDALRLKVNLHLIVGSYSTYSSVGGTYTTGNYTLPDEITVWHHETAGDACAAERLAITRAAAEIGRQMEVSNG